MMKEITNNEFPLYPPLPEQGVEEAQEYINNFKKELSKIAENTIEKLYCDVPIWIESDSWGNFRTFLLKGLTNYKNKDVQAGYDFAKIRRAMFEEYREEIISDISRDIIEENEKLKKEKKEIAERWAEERNNRY